MAALVTGADVNAITNGNGVPRNSSGETAMTELHKMETLVFCKKTTILFI